MSPTKHKIPRSVLVIVHTPELEVLMIERTDAAGFWQCVTGSLDWEEETYAAAAAREVFEETGLDAEATGHRLTDWWLENVYEIYPQWLYRYALGVFMNTERVFSLCIPKTCRVVLSPREHRAQLWLPWRDAALLAHSSSNAEAILLLPRFAQVRAI